MAHAMTQPTHRTAEATRTFKYAAAVYGFGTFVHTIDHFRRGSASVSDQVIELGTLGTVLAAIAITLALTDHRRAPLAAVVIGFPHAIGIAAVHWLPHWSVLSDSFFSAHFSPISWAAVALEVGGALAFAVTGVRLLRSST